MNVDDEHFTPAPSAAEKTSHLSLAELTHRAGVTVRTVRYYIAEGLLPPPLPAGRQSAYTEGHLDRLRLIAHLKDAYLPLREIRRRLAGLDDDAVRSLLEQNHPDQAAGPEADSARAYLDRVLPGAARPSRSGRAQPQVRQQLLREASPGTERYAAAAMYEPPMSAPARPLTIGAATPLSPSPAVPDPDREDAASEAWRRVRLADDAELLIRESAYRQRRDRIDWLIRWARRVFG
jgi:DNA-binding transcriptional MerR regulator